MSAQTNLNVGEGVVAESMAGEAVTGIRQVVDGAMKIDAQALVASLPALSYEHDSLFIESVSAEALVAEYGRHAMCILSRRLWRHMRRIVTVWHR